MIRDGRGRGERKKAPSSPTGNLSVSTGACHPGTTGKARRELGEDSSGERRAVSEGGQEGRCRGGC